MSDQKDAKPTIEEMEKTLNSGHQPGIEILPNGQISAKADHVELKSYPNLHAVPTKRLQINIVHTLIMAKGNINRWGDTVLKFLTDYRAEEEERDAEVEKIVREAPAFRCEPCGYKGNGTYEDVFGGGLLCPQCGEERLVETDLRDEILRRLREKP